MLEEEALPGVLRSLAGSMEVLLGFHKKKKKKKKIYFLPNYEDANSVTDLSTFLTLFNLLGS